MIGFLRQEQADIHAPQRGMPDRAQQRGIRHEIRTRQPEPRARGTDDFEDRRRAGIPRRRWTAGNRAGRVVSRGGMHVPGQVEDFPGREMPVLDEWHLEGADDGALEPHKRIAPRAKARAPAHVFVTDVQPSDKRLAPVGDHQLAVIAEVDPEALAAIPVGDERLQPDARAAQLREIGRGQPARADLVDQHVNVHAAPSRVQQPRLDVAAQRVVANDEKLDEQKLAGLVNGLADRGKRRLAINEEMRAVARGDRQMDQPLREADGVLVFLLESRSIGFQHRLRPLEDGVERGGFSCAGQRVARESRLAKDKKQRNRAVGKEHERHHPADRCLRRAGNQNRPQCEENARQVEQQGNRGNDRIHPHRRVSYANSPAMNRPADRPLPLPCLGKLCVRAKMDPGYDSRTSRRRHATRSPHVSPIIASAAIEGSGTS